MEIVVIGRTDIERILTPQIALRLVADAMHRVSNGTARHLVRRILPLPNGGGIVGDMPGTLGHNAAFGLKCLSIRSEAPFGRTPHRGYVVLFEPTRGDPVAVLEAGAITALRTAAATAFATSALARPSARTLAVLGAGEQAAHHIPALLEVCSLTEIVIWGRRRAAADALAQDVRARFAIPVRTVASALEAARADIVCTLTSADMPILFGEWISPGTHVNLVGSSTAGPREADNVLVARSKYFVDSIQSALVHASELLSAKEEGLIGDGHIRGEIGAVASGHVQGRTADHDITVYKSLGHIAQDLAVGWYVYEQARALRLGTRAAFD